MPTHPNSNALWKRAQRVLAGGPGTFSKHWERYPQGIGPFALVSGESCYVTGDDGRQYLDTIAALGPILLGYGHPDVSKAVQEQASCGTSFSMVHPLEIAVAELMCDMLPCAEMVRFCRNGTDATGMAVRLSRAITKHQHAVFVGYHGGAMDSYGITTDKCAGILPQLAPYNHQVTWDTIADIPKRSFDDLACIMVEVPALAWGTSWSHYRDTLLMLQEMAHECDALFVMDEVVSFPRCDAGGAQRFYNVVPDLTCVSKGIANGMPLAALVGKRCYMERFDAGDIFASWTFAGETTSLAAAQVTLGLARWHGALEPIHAHGQKIGDGLRALFLEYGIPAQVYGHPWRIAVKWHHLSGIATAEELRTIWLSEHVKLGILHGIGVIFPMSCYDDYIVDFILYSAKTCCEIIQKAIQCSDVRDYIDCPIIGDVLSVRR
jgi:glutamate-1-semialdehyde aminotransferase